jgi:hypothetical protein
LFTCFTFLTAILGEFFLRGLVVDGDAAATATNLLGHPFLFRLGLATGLISTGGVAGVNIPKGKKKQDLGELTERSPSLGSATPVTHG